MSVVDQIILLHDVDSKLFEINKLLGGLPGQVEELATQEQNLKNSQNEKDNSEKTSNSKKSEVKNSENAKKSD